MAERVHIDYEPLPAISRAVDAIKPGAPALWDEAPDNLCIDIEAGDATATSTAFARAAHVVRLDTWVQRVTGVPLEAAEADLKFARAEENIAPRSATLALRAIG
jgi:aerobic carbon-monoxide dehydrogenase large subunit